MGARRAYLGDSLRLGDRESQGYILLCQSEMATAVCRKRLQRELVALKKNPVEHMVAAPHEKNILEWHYVIEGPKDSV